MGLYEISAEIERVVVNGREMSKFIQLYQSLSN